MGLFGKYAVRIDPWQAEYGPELAADSETRVARESVLEDAEIPRQQWRPILPTSAVVPSALVFVDGVRRIDLRIQIGVPEGVVYGAFGSYAVGSVRIRKGKASFAEIRVERVVATGSGVELPQSVPVSSAALYQPIHAPEPDVDAPLRRLQHEMRHAEERLARAFAGQDDALVLSDGPLTLEAVGRGHAVGYIKRISEFYISDPQFLKALHVGTRTPLFAIHAERWFARYSWFVRVAEPRVGDSPMSGIVRLEVSASAGDVEAALKLADTTASVLPRFAPSRARDPRAPQNLIPIGALESHLRHMMGDAALQRRHIEAVIIREARRG